MSIGHECSWSKTDWSKQHCWMVHYTASCLDVVDDDVAAAAVAACVGVAALAVYDVAVYVVAVAASYVAVAGGVVAVASSAAVDGDYCAGYDVDCKNLKRPCVY